MKGFAFAIFLKEYFRFLDGGSSCRRYNGDYSSGLIRPQSMPRWLETRIQAGDAGTESLEAIVRVLPSIGVEREFRGKPLLEPVYTHLAGPCYVFIPKLKSSGANPV